MVGTISAHFGTYWNAVSSHFDRELIEEIESCSIKLAQFAPDASLREEELEHIQRLLGEIKNQLTLDTIIDEPLKAKLDERFRRVEEAIKNVWIDGAEPVQTELEATIATVVVESQNRSSPVKKAVTVIGQGLVQVLRVAQLWNLVHDGIPALPFFEEPEPPAIHGQPPQLAKQIEIVTAHVVADLDDSN